MKNRKLVLRKETLTELDTSDLASVAGGTSATCITYSVLVTGCWCSGMYPSLNIDCPTGHRCQN